MAVMNRMRSEGYLKIGLVGLEEEGGPAPAAAGDLATSPPAAALQDAPE